MELVLLLAIVSGGANAYTQNAASGRVYRAAGIASQTVAWAVSSANTDHHHCQRAESRASDEYHYRGNEDKVGVRHVDHPFPMSCGNHVAMTIGRGYRSAQ